jgi:hypothetical protein
MAKCVNSPACFAQRLPVRHDAQLIEKNLGVLLALLASWRFLQRQSLPKGYRSLDARKLKMQTGLNWV